MPALVFLIHKTYMHVYMRVQSTCTCITKRAHKFIHSCCSKCLSMYPLYKYVAEIRHSAPNSVSSGTVNTGPASEGPGPVLSALHMISSGPQNTTNGWVVLSPLDKRGNWDRRRPSPDHTELPSGRDGIQTSKVWFQSHQYMHSWAYVPAQYGVLCDESVITDFPLFLGAYRSLWPPAFGMHTRAS